MPITLEESEPLSIADLHHLTEMSDASYWWLSIRNWSPGPHTPVWQLAGVPTQKTVVIKRGEILCRGFCGRVCRIWRRNSPAETTTRHIDGWRRPFAADVFDTPRIDSVPSVR